VRAGTQFAAAGIDGDVWLKVLVRLVVDAHGPNAPVTVGPLDDRFRQPALETDPVPGQARSFRSRQIPTFGRIGAIDHDD
jgi:hypothetical protein